MISKRRAVTAGLVVLASVIGLAVYDRTGWTQWEGRVVARKIDLAHPDVLVSTHSLKSFPRDLLLLSLAKDLLTEDLVEYYEESPDRLSISGSLRRIAYEHELKWSDEILSWVLAEPAQLALWAGPAGSLDDWALVVARPDLSAILQEAASVALKDKHLKVAATIAPQGREMTVYALDYGNRKTLLFAALKDRLVVLSDPGLLLDASRAPVPEAAAVVGRLLSGEDGQRDVWREAMFLPHDEEAEHSITADARWLSFGYGRFFPALKGLRLEFGNGTWATEALVDPSAGAAPGFADRSLWASVPANPALCVLLPVEWKEGRPLGAHASPEVAQALSTLSGSLDGPAAACWYGDGRLQAPLLAGSLKDVSPQASASLSSAFNWGIRAPKRQGRVQPTTSPSGATLWQRDLEVPFASSDEDGRPVPGEMRITLAAQGRHVFFSTDEKQVRQALLTANRRFPSLGETLPEEGITLGVVVPRAMGEIFRREALVMLPRADEPVFRSAAERHLLPRLDALSRYPAYRLELPSLPTERSWQRVLWQELKS